MNSFSVKSHLLSENLVLLRKCCKRMRCFLDKFTHLAQFLHDRRSRQFHLQPFLLQKYLSIFNYMDKISYNPFVVHSDEVVHNFSLIYLGAWFLILLLLWVYHPLRFCLCQWEKYFEFGTFVCAFIYYPLRFCLVSTKWEVQWISEHFVASQAATIWNQCFEDDFL